MKRKSFLYLIIFTGIFVIFVLCLFANVAKPNLPDTGTETATGIGIEAETDAGAETDTEVATGTGIGVDTDIEVDTGSESMELLETTGTVEPLVPGDIISNAVLEAKGIDNLFYSTEISPEIQNRIAGVSYQENDTIALSELRYIRVLYYGFAGETHIGELIVNQKIEADILEIMKELYENQYPIEKMVLIDEYGADDEDSMADNNTSAFNYRSINGSTKLSKHSLGLAIDINPRYNPCVRTKDGELSVEPVNGNAYTDRTQEFPYKINENDLCYRLFTAHGFTWGGSWNSLKDYQHFEKDI